MRKFLGSIIISFLFSFLTIAFAGEEIQLVYLVPVMSANTATDAKKVLLTDPPPTLAIKSSTISTKKQEKQIAVGLLGAMALIDYNQSVEMFFQRKGLHEINPILGKHPSRGGMLAFGIAGVALTYIGAMYLPEPWATICLDSVMASEQWNIEDNEKVQQRGERRINSIPIILRFRLN